MRCRQKAMSTSPPATARSSASPLPVRTSKLMPGYSASMACITRGISTSALACGTPRLTWPRFSVRSASTCASACS